MPPLPGAAVFGIEPPEKWVLKERPRKPRRRGNGVLCVMETRRMLRRISHQAKDPNVVPNNSRLGTKKHPVEPPIRHLFSHDKNGVGNVVSREGYVLTNNHVVKIVTPFASGIPIGSTLLPSGRRRSKPMIYRSSNRWTIRSAATFRGASPIRPGEAVCWRWVSLSPDY